MRTRTVIKMTKNLTPAEYAQCYSKNFGEEGYMRENFEMDYGDPDIPKTASKVIMIKDEAGDVIAWALNQREGKDKWSSMFFVVDEYRRQGYGTRLMYHVKTKIDPQPRIHPHDRPSSVFFNQWKGKVRVASYDRWYLDYYSNA